ncbi:MAG: type II secretion system protein [Pseudomonadales bacterium]|nr:type II secretion system protein [Pseudomonadales bacterium]
MKRSDQQGLSLLEVLVVFVIVAMVSTAIVQGFGFGLSLYERVQTKSQRQTVNLLSTKWFQMVNQSLVPSKEVGRSLVGASGSFSAITVNPLLADPGMPAPINWSIEDNILIYGERDQKLGILRLSGRATFEYRTDSGEWVVEWPIDEESYSLPSAIRLRNEDWFVTAAIRGKLEPNLLLDESRRER